MTTIDAWAARPELGAILMSLAAQELSRGTSAYIRSKNPMNEGLAALIKGAGLDEGSLRSALNDHPLLKILEGMGVHDCEHCSGYDACDLSIKKPREEKGG